MLLHATTMLHAATCPVHRILNAKRIVLLPSTVPPHCAPHNLRIQSTMCLQHKHKGMLIVLGSDAQELQEGESEPAIVALASLPDLLKRPAIGGLARQADDLICHSNSDDDDSCSLICHNSSDDDDSCSIISDTSSNSSSIASFISEVTSPTGQQAGGTNEQGSLYISRSTAESSINALWADLAEYPAFSQDMYLSSRWVSTSSFLLSTMVFLPVSDCL